MEKALEGPPLIVAFFQSHNYQVLVLYSGWRARSGPGGLRGAAHAAAVRRREPGFLRRQRPGAAGEEAPRGTAAKLPARKIDALSMYNVIQVACGHYHSIALTKDGRVFSWGQNSHGQLGLGKELPSQATPCNISSLAGIPLAQVAAGGAHSFVLSHSGVVYGWGKNNAHQLGLNQKTSKEQIFKPYSVGALRNLDVTYVSCGDEHTAVLTKSGNVFTFGDDSAGQLGHNSSKTGPQKIDEIDGPVSHVSCGRSDVSMDCFVPVNLQEAREVLKELTMRDWIARQMRESIDGLAYNLDPPSGTSSGVKIVLTIDSSLLDHLFLALPRSSPHQEALAIFLLVPECCVALGACRIPSLALRFAEAVTGLSKGSSNILGPFLEQIVQMLKTCVSAILPSYTLYPKDKSWIPILKVLKKLYKINMKAKGRLQTSTFCIDEIPQKINLEEDFWRWELHKLLKTKAYCELNNSWRLRNSDLPECPTFTLKVRRHCLVEDTWHKLSILEDSYLKKHLLPSVEKNKYFLFGILCGLSIANRVTAYIPFPLAIFKKLLNKKPTLSDVKELSPVLGRRDFVDKYVDYIFNKSVDDVFSEFKRGFYKVLDEQLVGIFEPEQLMEVAIGNANYDWDLYEKSAVYWDIYSPTHPTIKMFWEVFHELSLEDKKRFLVFVAGSDRIPVTGMEFWKITICPHDLPSEDLIPEAWICHHLFVLPFYSTKQKLKEKLLQAISNHHGFGKFAHRV
ncbi:putative E3 ubiquitin-protein ligase HERC6, partial [Ophiophagus hannah]